MSFINLKYMILHSSLFTLPSSLFPFHSSLFTLPFSLFPFHFSLNFCSLFPLFCLFLTLRKVCREKNY